MKEQEQADEELYYPHTALHISRISKEQVHSRSPHYKVKLIWNASTVLFQDIFNDGSVLS